MKKIFLIILGAVILLFPFRLSSQSNITIDIGASMEIQTGADVCADTRTINGILFGNGTWCLVPLTPAAPLLISPANNATAQLTALSLIWQKSFGAVTYRVQLSADSLFSSLIVNDSTLIDSVKSVSGLNPLTFYWWRVNAKGIGGTSAYSVVYKFKTLGYPNPVSLINPPNNAVNQPVSILFRWSRASEQTAPLEFSDKKPVSKIFTHSDLSDGIDAIGNYWFDLVTDTVSMANLTRDTLLTDTTKSVSSLTNNTNYWWRVRAKNQIGWGNYSAWFKFTTIIAVPPPPVLSSPVNNSVGQNLALTLVWNKSSFASTYRVQVAADSLFASLIINDSTLTDSTRAISGLAPLTNYWWRVNAKNIGGTSAYSTVWKFKTLGTPLAVTLINPPNNAVNQPVSIQFRWGRASEQTAPSGSKDKEYEKTNHSFSKLNDDFDAISSYWFDLVTDTVSMANLIRDTVLTDTNKTVSGLANLTSYFWRVKAKNQIGWGSYSVWYKFTTLIAVPPPPVLSSPPNNSVGQNLALTLVWNKSVFASTYRVQVAADSLFNVLIVNDSTLTDSTKAVSGLNPLTNYWWRVNAKSAGGTSAYSTVWKFKTLGTPLAVTLINPPNNAINQPVSIQFRWSKAFEQTAPIAKEKNENIQRDDIDAISSYWFDLVTDTVSMANLTRDTLLTDTTKSVSGLSNNTNYWWRVKAKNQIGWGGFSAWWKFTTIVPVPAPPVLFSPANNAINQPVALNLVWLKSLYAASYRVQLSTDSLFNNLVVNDSTVTDSIRAVSGLNNSTSYWWRVNAKNISGTSVYSQIRKFTTQVLGPALVTLKVIPGGFYNASSGRLNMRDTIRALLIDSANCLRVDSSRVVIDSVTFSGSLSFANANTGNYFLYIFHRNHVFISARYKQNIIRGSTVSYDFTTDSAKAFGFNMIKVSSSPVRWGMIPGDANQDGFVDGLDQTVWLSQNGLDGYLSADFNGDSFVDGLDQTLWLFYNGQSYFVPCELSFENPVEHKQKTNGIKNKQMDEILSPKQNKRQ